jgi:hypothetical protein
MKLNSKLTWGLAWAGLAVVVAVPSADMLTGKMGANTAAVITSTTDPVVAPVAVETAIAAPSSSIEPAAPVLKTAAVTTKVTKTGVTIVPAGTDISAAGDPVDKLLKSGKPMPDYISDDSTTATAAPAKPAAPVVTGNEVTQVAAIDPVAPVVAPVPFPSLARPKITATKPVVAARPDAPVVIVDEPQQQAAVDAPDVAPLPPAGIADDNAASWRQARLNRYLERHGLVDDSGDSTASVTVQKPSSNYDADGFYLNEGPNAANDRSARRRARIDRMFGDDDSDYADDGSTSFDLF